MNGTPIPSPIKDCSRQAVTIAEADLQNPIHQAAVLKLVDAYSMDPMGDAKPLAEQSRQRLLSGLQAHPTTLIFLAFLNAKPIGIAVCFRGFSTFAALPLMNIHDLAVLPEHRGLGVGKLLLAAVEAKSISMGCCKLTLEVLEKNERARAVYKAAGFAEPVYHDEAELTLFLSKKL